MSDITPTPSTGWITPDPSAPPIPAGGAPGPLPVRLWTPRDIGVVSFLLGFPAGLGVTAVNSYRLGRHGLAYGLLAAGAAVFLGLSIVNDLPAGVGVALNSGISFGLYALARRQRDAAELAGRAIEPGGGPRGLLAAAGGWLVTLLPTVVLVVALTFLGAQVAGILKGTVEFGTGGDQCEVTGATTTFTPPQSIHFVADLNRKVVPGETIHVSLTDDLAGMLLDETDEPVTTAADCVWGTFEASGFASGSYTLNYKVGSELLAHGQFTVTSPGASLK